MPLQKLNRSKLVFAVQFSIICLKINETESHANTKFPFLITISTDKMEYRVSFSSKVIESSSET